MFENANLSDVINVLDSNPLYKVAYEKKKKALEKIQDFIDDRLREEKQFYVEEYADNYAEAMRKDKIPATICESDEFIKLVAEYMEWSI